MHKLESKVRDKTIYYLACQEGACSFGALQPNQELSTGLEELKTFELEEELEKAVDMMNGAGHYQSIVNPPEPELEEGIL